jgi:hypothetical protein
MVPAYDEPGSADTGPNGVPRRTSPCSAAPEMAESGKESGPAAGVDKDHVLICAPAAFGHQAKQT